MNSCQCQWFFLTVLNCPKWYEMVKINIPDTYKRLQNYRCSFYEEIECFTFQSKCSIFPLKIYDFSHPLGSGIQIFLNFLELLKFMNFLRLLKALEFPQTSESLEFSQKKTYFIKLSFPFRCMWFLIWKKKKQKMNWYWSNTISSHTDILWWCDNQSLWMKKKKTRRVVEIPWQKHVRL